MLSNKGQALLEFVLILPIILMLLFATIDFGRIIYEKNRLENAISDATEMVKNNDDEATIKEKLKENYDMPIVVTVERKKVNVIVKLSTSIDIITPGLDFVFKSPYVIEASRVMYNE